jgi:hypothetical protein
MIEHLLQTLSPECAEELKVVLETPQDQQTKDQLTPECNAAVQSGAASWRQANGAGGAAAEGGGEDGAAQQRAAPRKYERVKLPPKGSGAKKGSSSFSGGRKAGGGAKGPSLWTRLAKTDWSEYSEVGKLLFFLFAVVTGFVLYAYSSFQQKEDLLTPEQKRVRAEEEAAETEAKKKAVAKAERQGRATKDQ